ncbi:hypothetical protein ACHAWO_005692 [Cyclotella atomus]|uniref:Uncharacterized protein n=1 Tax=Cyclotella atomus TaxID=382360 RepID=A0ABD3P898_9STRA
MAMNGQALPPGVAGPCIGTLEIRVIDCLVPNFLGGSFQFWGTGTEQLINLTRGIKFLLVGTVASVEKYLHDASPLLIKIIGENGVQIGVCSIASLTLTDLIVQESDDHPVFSRQHSLEVFPSEQNQFHIGFITLDISFHVGSSAQSQDYINRQSTSCAPLHDQDDNTNETADEQQSLLDDLLDLCDDVTIPTLPESCDTTTNYADPWISRIEKGATQLSNQPRSLGIRIEGISISSEVLDSLTELGGKICFYLRYTLADRSDEILVNEHTVNPTNATTKTPVKKRPKANNQFAQLLDKPNDNEIAISLSDKEAATFDEGIQFYLFYSHARNQQSKTPKRKKNASTPVRGSHNRSPGQDRTCLATATLNLREFVSNTNQLNDSVTVDLVPAKPSSTSAVSKAGVLTLNLSSSLLVSGTTTVCLPRHEEGTVSNSVASSCSERVPNHLVEPHHVSVFLSNFANRALNMKREHFIAALPPTHLMNNNRTGVSETRSKPTKCAASVPTSLQPVRPSPLWMSVAVSSIKLESTNEQCKVRLRLSCDLAESSIDDEKEFDSQCCWQFSLRNRDAESVTFSIELADKISLNAMARVHFNNKRDGQKASSNDMQTFVTSGWFDIVGSSCESTIGRIHVESSIGTLKNTRSFPLQCICAVTIQRWWRKTSTKPSQQAVQNMDEGSTSNSSKPHNRNENEDVIDAISNPDLDVSNSPESPRRAVAGASYTSSPSLAEEPKPYQGEEFNEVMSPGPKDVKVIESKVQVQMTNESSSSPDSLFEEWSRQSAVDTQSLSLSREFVASQMEVVAPKLTPLIDPPSSKLGADGNSNDERECDRSGSPELRGVSDVSFHLQQSIPADPPANEIDSLERRVQRSAGSETAKRLADDASFDPETKSSTPSHPEIKIEVCVLKVGGLSHLISRWCAQNQSTALPVSGVFISFSAKHEKSKDEELQCIFASDDIFHSGLIPMHAISRDVEFDDFKAELHISDYEMDLAKLQLQCLEVKLWLVPVVTRTVAEMFNQDRVTQSEAHCLSGCQLIATAPLPLYHLYTSQTQFDGRVAWSVRGQIESSGFVAARVNRLFETNRHQLGLNHNICSSPTINRRQSVDPPPSSSMSNKRKVGSTATIRCEEVLNCRSIKRTRLMLNDSDTSADAESLETQIREQTGSHLTSSDKEVGESNSTCTRDLDSFVSQSRQEGATSTNTATPVRDSNHVVHHHVHTCERGTSPVLVALRYADAGVCTSPCEKTANESKVRSTHEPGIERNDSSTPLHDSSVTENLEQQVHQHKTASHSNATNDVLHEPGCESDLNRVRPHRLRSQLIQSYFSSPRAIHSTVQGYRSIRSPVTSNQNTFNKMNTVSFVATVQSPPGISSGRIRNPSAQKSSPSIKPLSNRERIERIFSGKK